MSEKPEFYEAAFSIENGYPVETIKRDMIAVRETLNIVNRARELGFVGKARPFAMHAVDIPLPNPVGDMDGDTVPAMRYTIRIQGDNQ